MNTGRIILLGIVVLVLGLIVISRQSQYFDCLTDSQCEIAE